MLSDNSPKNDLTGFKQLAEVLLHSGDLENAGATYGVTMIEYENRRAVFAERRKRVLERDREAEIDRYSAAAPHDHRKRGTSQDHNEGALDPSQSPPAFSSLLKSNSLANAELSLKSPQCRRTSSSLFSTWTPLGKEENLCQCNGPCNRHCEEFDAYYVCHYCLVGLYREECYAKIKSGALGSPYYAS